jgi:hypothetical protein
VNLTRRFLIPTLALLCGAGALHAQGAKTRVAVMPTSVLRGLPDNGTALTTALRESLEKHGFDVVPADAVDAAIRDASMDLTKSQTIGVLAKLRGNLKAVYLVYPRVLTVGVGAEPGDLQANFLVNVVGKSNGSYLHTRQIGQIFRLPAEAQVIIPAPEAAEAAGRLLDGFYEKAK